MEPILRKDLGEVITPPIKSSAISLIQVTQNAAYKYCSSLRDVKLFRSHIIMIMIIMVIIKSVESVLVCACGYACVRAHERVAMCACVCVRE